MMLEKTVDLMNNNYNKLLLLTKIHKGSSRIITTLEEGQLLQMEAIMSEESDKLIDVIEL